MATRQEDPLELLEQDQPGPNSSFFPMENYLRKITQPEELIIIFLNFIFGIISTAFLPSLSSLQIFLYTPLCSPSSSWPLFSLVAVACVYVFVYKNVNLVCSVCIMRPVCMLLGLTFWHRTNGVLFPGEGHSSHLSFPALLMALCGGVRPFLWGEFFSL